MDANTEQSSNANGQGSSKRRGVMSTLRWMRQLPSDILQASGSALVLFALALLLLPDFLSFNRRQSKTPNPTTRKLPIPVRNGGDIFAIMPDGSRVKVEPLAAVTHARAWSDVCFGAMVWEKTKLPEL